VNKELFRQYKECEMKIREINKNLEQLYREKEELERQLQIRGENNKDE